MKKVFSYLLLLGLAFGLQNCRPDEPTPDPTDPITPADTTITPADTTITPADTTITPVDTIVTPTDTITPADTITTPADTIVVVVDAFPGSLTGIFSVSDTRKVLFSQGNLQYKASTKTWRFAEHQQDTIGIANSNISDSYDGWIDLFGWSTAATCYGVSSSTSNADYSGDFVDWGSNAISNGGDTANLWFTLSGDEWEYLLFTRPNGKSLLFRATVNGQTGMVLLPDGYPTESLTYTAYPADYTDNVFGGADWQVLENAGAVFLPCAGRRGGTSVVNVGKQGEYWSSTIYYAAYAIIGVDFSSSSVYVQGGGSRYGGYSVRLVRELK